MLSIILQVSLGVKQPVYDVKHFFSLKKALDVKEHYEGSLMHEASI